MSKITLEEFKNALPSNLGKKASTKLVDKINDILYRDWETDRKSTRLNSSHRSLSRMPSSA